jgi:DNA-binding NarL/FixJ family response regulator
MPFPDRVLTPRESEIITLLILGCRDREIATQLTIGPETVKTHVRSILLKMGARTRASAAVKYTLKNQRQVIDSLLGKPSLTLSRTED